MFIKNYLKQVLVLEFARVTNAFPFGERVCNFFIKNNNMWKLIFCSFQKQASGTKEINHSKSALMLQFQYRDKSNKINNMKNYTVFYLQELVYFWVSILILMCLLQEAGSLLWPNVCQSWKKPAG